MNLLLITDENKSHYVYLKDFNIVMCNKKIRKKKHFYGYFLQFLVVKKTCNNITKFV